MNQSETLDRVFDAIADATRRSILDRLQKGPLTVTALAEPYDMSLNGVSKHLKKLQQAGLIKREIRGREHYCQLDAQRLQSAMEWMAHYRQFWTERLNALESHLVEKRKGGKR